MEHLLLSTAGLADSDGNTRNISISIEGGLIERIDEAKTSPENAIDLSNCICLPGFVDVHIHGAIGLDVNEADIDGLIEIAKFLVSNGVTAWMPTLVPDLDENYRRAIAAIDRLMEIQNEMPIAQAVGVHYEGVFANEKMCGALRPEYFKTFTGNTPLADYPDHRNDGHASLNQEGSQDTTRLKTGRGLLGLLRLKNGVHMMTLAPEVVGGIELIRELRRQGWVVSIGHTRADISVLSQAFEAGAKHLTHFYNAMTGLHHRDVGVVGWALTNDDVTFDIIADGVHVHPKMLEFACRSKSSDKVTLISDSVAPTGFGDGEYEIWGEKISVVNGRTENERGSIAGSVITMRDAVKRMISLGFSVNDVSKMASLNPARLLGIDSNYGSIEVGKRADLVALDKEGNVKLVIVGGNVAFES